MIVEFVQFTYPPGLTREQILEDARKAAIFKTLQKAARIA
jgi:hypothetical protein